MFEELWAAELHYIFQNDADIDDRLSFLRPLDLITKDSYELQKIVKEKKESNDVSQSKVDRACPPEEERAWAREFWDLRIQDKE